MKKGSQKTTEVSTQTVTDLTQLTQANIPAMLKQITSKIKELSGGVPKEASTSGKKLPGFNSEIKNINSVVELIMAHSSVTNKAKVYKISAKALGVDVSKYPFKLEGCSESQWVNDITLATNIVKNKAELKKLSEMKALLEENLSAKDKLAKDLNRIANLLNE